MEHSLEYQAPLRKRGSWIREIPAASGDGPKIAFVLFIVFLLMLYSNVAVIFKAQLDALRPTLVVALCGVYRGLRQDCSCLPAD
jgi:hypothetical protein